MRPTLIASAALLLALALAGCGGKQAQQEQSSATAAPPVPAAGAAADYVVPADLDQGPRAAASAVDEEKAELGEKLFNSKGCVACHAFGKRMSGPDLAGVTRSRTERWMESQILHPDKMTQQDPISKELFATYKVQMTNFGLTPDEAKAIVEFLKKKDKESGK